MAGNKKRTRPVSFKKKRSKKPRFEGESSKGKEEKVFHINEWYEWWSSGRKEAARKASSRQIAKDEKEFKRSKPWVGSMEEDAADVGFLSDEKDVIIDYDNLHLTFDPEKSLKFNYLSPDEAALVKADKQAMNIILYGLPNDIFALVYSYPNAFTIWKAVEHLIQGTKMGLREKKLQLLWEYEKFTSEPGESLESYYSRFSKIVNDLNRNNIKFENLIFNIKFLLSLQPEWKRFVNQVKQSKDVHEIDFHKIYDIWLQNQDEANDVKADLERRKHDPLALVASTTVHPTTSHMNHAATTPHSYKYQAPTPSPRQYNGYAPSGYALPAPTYSSSAYEAPAPVYSTTAYVAPATTYTSNVAFGHRAKECKEKRRVQDSEYHKEKMLRCKKDEAGIPLTKEEHDFLAEDEYGRSY
ncbi:hypothetical protein CTI12_AA215480 [Artemisia annua]|uniref:Gag-Pol polyprotein n=1 Tax=Artemisia annua TaxID=35608 RepID=A0A2U1NY03_ARTAN|nr:hypothetical protein CTI12_AA215480 [Artemisia annua]